MAYITFKIDETLLPGDNYISLNGKQGRIGASTIYKVPAGYVNVKVHSATGEEWYCDGSLQSDSNMILRLAVDGEGSVVDTEYAITRLNSSQTLAYAMCGQKL